MLLIPSVRCLLTPPQPDYITVSHTFPQENLFVWPGRSAFPWPRPAPATHRRGKLGLPIERDLHFEADKPISAYADEARTRGHIVT